MSRAPEAQIARRWRWRSARRLRDVGAESRCRRQFGQQRQQNCAGAGADIGDTQWTIEVAAARSISSASSTTVSVSGRGTSVAGESCNGSPQNSFSPIMRATGSPAIRRCAYCANSAASAEVSRRVACAIMPVRSRSTTAPTKNACIELGFVAAGRLQSRRQRPTRTLNAWSGICHQCAYLACHRG